jgi:lysosomal alpha-mannosidase
MDEYYYGSNFDVQHASVKAILDTTINELGKDKSRKYTFAEMGFFQQWYND